MLSVRNSLTGNGANKNDVRLNKGPMKKLQDWDRMGKPRRQP